MHIYIDESGNFIPQNGRGYRVSVLAALVVPDVQRNRLFRDFMKLRESWCLPPGEVKGSSLNANQVRNVIELLRRYDVFVEANAVEHGQQYEADVVYHRRHQADQVTSQITAECHDGLVRQLQGARTQVVSLKPQLYNQFIATLDLVPRILQHAVLYYETRKPKELSEFQWIFDAKDPKKKTKYEEIWHLLICPIIEARSIHEPFLMVRGFAYTHFKKYLKTKSLSDGTEAQGPCLNLILKDKVRFENSATEVGLQLVDIIACTIARAMNDKLEYEGWKEIGRLFIIQRSHSLHLLRLTSAPITAVTKVASNSQAKVIREVNKRAKAMFKDKFYR
jgi:hypothetical protein